MKKLKKFMAALLVALMALAVIPAGVFAEGNEDTSSVFTFTPDVVKVVEGSNVSFPQTFNFKLSLIETSPVGSFTASTVEDKTVSVEVTADNKTNATVDFGSFVLAPGIYKFAVTETANSAFVTTPSSTIYAYVAVNNAGVASVSYSDKNTALNPNEDGTIVVDGKAEKATFTNTVSTGNNFSFEKRVTGTASNPGDSFAITIQANLPAGSTATVTLTRKADGTTVPVTLTSDNKSNTFEGIKNGDTITSTAMPTGTVVTITEGQNDYTQDWSISDNGSFNEGGSNLSKSITINGETQVVTLNNNRTATTITGFVMHYAPYIALIAFAGVAVVLVAKRRNHSEF